MSTPNSPNGPGGRSKTSSQAIVKERAKVFGSVKQREGDTEGTTEIFEGAIFTHHFVDAFGDHETVRFHYVEARPATGESIVFLHGIPDSWFQWHLQMVTLAKVGYRCVAPDLKGNSQSEKKPGDYRHEGAADNLYSMLQGIGIAKFNIVSHDRGTVQGDYITAKHPEAGDIFKNAPYNGIMNDPARFVVWVYTWVAKEPIPDETFPRVVQEYCYPDITHAVPRYFNPLSFSAEWLDRRNRLLALWKCPVMIMQGYDSPTQPREFYENARNYIPNSKDVKVKYMLEAISGVWRAQCRPQRLFKNC